MAVKVKLEKDGFKKDAYGTLCDRAAKTYRGSIDFINGSAGAAEKSQGIFHTLLISYVFYSYSLDLLY